MKNKKAIGVLLQTYSLVKETTPVMKSARNRSTGERSKIVEKKLPKRREVEAMQEGMLAAITMAACLLAEEGPLCSPEELVKGLYSIALENLLEARVPRCKASARCIDE